MRNFVYILLFICLIKTSDSLHHKWAQSKRLEEWLHPFDLCLLQDSRNVSISIISKDCQEKISKENTASEKPLPPVRCRLGNTWPSKSEYCDPTDIPFSNRLNLQSAVQEYDDPKQTPLKDFFHELAKQKGLLLLIGDSVMQQFFSALACELEREQVWKDPSLFTNTDELRHVSFESSTPNQMDTADIKFLPIYHLVNGRYDRIPHAAFTSMSTKLQEYLTQYKTLVIIINMGLHYIDNPVHGFSRKDYQEQMTKVLTYLHHLTTTTHPTRLHIYWRETSAQHFDTPNGYWPGAKFIHQMKQHVCQPIRSTSMTTVTGESSQVGSSVSGNGHEIDWRNRDIEEILRKEKLSAIQIMPFFDITLPLWSEHPNGHLRDCTHFCWSPMFYQPLFHQLRQVFYPLSPPS